MKKPIYPAVSPDKYHLLYRDSSNDDTVPFSTIINEIGKRYFGRSDVTLKEITDKYGLEFLSTIVIRCFSETVDLYDYDAYTTAELKVEIENPNYEKQLKEYDEKILEYNKQLSIYKQYEKTKSRKKVP